MIVRIERKDYVRKYERVDHVILNVEFGHLDVIFEVANGTDVDNFLINELTRVVIEEDS